MDDTLSGPRLAVEKEFDGSAVSGVVRATQGELPGLVLLSLAAKEETPTTEEETRKVYRDFLPTFAASGEIDPLPSSRHCGAI